MPNGDQPRERFIASLIEAKAKPRKQRKLTLKSIVAENLTEIIQSREEDGLDLDEIAAKLAEAYDFEINKRSFRTTVSLLRSRKVTRKTSTSGIGGPRHETAPTVGMTTSPSLSGKLTGSVETIREDDPDL